MKKIVVGISGGIDSAVTAASYKEQGYEVFGLHLRLSSEQEDTFDTIELLKEKLGIKIAILDVSKEFNTSVIRYFREEHLKGNSPSPCAMCNPDFKWKQLIDYADKNAIEKIASGHYIQTTFLNNKWWVKQGSDEKKDQSYFLWGLSQSTLSKIATPLGEITKQETRNRAIKYKLQFLEKKKESTGLCFAGKLSYAQLITKHIPEAKLIPKGDIIDQAGNIIGKHKGFIYYTIGQKKDLEFIEKSGLCVTEIDAKSNILTAGKPTDLWAKKFYITQTNFTDIDLALSETNLSVKIRGFGWNPDGFGEITRIDTDLFEVNLEQPAWAPAPGQPAVFYLNNLVVGGGIICKK